MTVRPGIYRPPVFGKRYIAPDKKRLSAAKQGYGRQWRRLRAEFLKRFPFCAACGEAATEVDHIVALRKGGSNDWSNLQAVCKRCHARKTVAQDGALSR